MRAVILMFVDSVLLLTKLFTLNVLVFID